MIRRSRLLAISTAAAVALGLVFTGNATASAAGFTHAATGTVFFPNPVTQLGLPVAAAQRLYGTAAANTVRAAFAARGIH